MVLEKRVDDALVNVWRPVQLFGLVRSISQSDMADEPLYAEPDRVEPLVKEKRVPPRDTPEIVEFWSWLLPMDVVATTAPPSLTARSA